MSIFKKTKRELRKFGLTMAVAFAVFGGLFLWRAKPVWPYFFGIAGFFLIFGLLFPNLLAPIEWAWMKMAHLLGQVMTRLILTLTFYLVITPLGLIMKLSGKDPLHRQFDRSASTYWVPVDPDGPTSRPDKPY
jgi:predicted anti-sigma-YlaC factor YlaD